MSNANQKPTTVLDHVIIRHRFAVRMWDTWGAPSLIVLLDGKERRALRETFNIMWQDLDVHMRYVEECLRSGSAVDSKVRRTNNVKVVYELKKRPDGILVVLYIATLYDNAGHPCFVMPAVDDDGNRMVNESGQAMVAPAKLSFERMFPADCVDHLFRMADAFVAAIDAFKVSLWAKEEGNEKIYRQIRNALENANESLTGTDRDSLTATVEETAARREASRQPKKGKEKRRQAAKIGIDPIKAPPADPTDETAQRLSVALLGSVADGLPPVVEEEELPAPPPPPVEGDHMVPTVRGQRMLEAAAAGDPSASPYAKASGDRPAPQPKKKDAKPRQAPVKLGFQDALASLKDKLPPGPSDGSNGQS